MKTWKNALVTGAAQGIGAALCQNLLQNGIKVTGIDIETPRWAENYASNQLKILNIDLINRNSVNSFIDQLQNELKYDLVIHNAGISATGKFEEIDDQAHERLLRLNLEAPIIMNVMMGQAGLYAKPANLVFISSLSHATGYPGAASYGASKDAIAIYAKSIRKDFAKQGIKVTSVFPGPTKTDHAERYAPKGADASKRMLPEVLAAKILDAAAKGQKSLYPDMAAKGANLIGKIAPKFMSRLMKKIIYDKLDKPVW